MQVPTPAMIQEPAGPRRSLAARLLRRISVVALLIMLAAGIVGIVGFMRFSAEVAELRDAGDSLIADGIVVLTGGKDRIETGLELLGERKGRRLLISGVHPQTSANAIRVAVGGNSRLFDCCVDIDRAALDTFGNAAEAGKWAHRNGFDSLIVVTSDYHMPRSLMEMRRTNPDIRMVPYLVPHEDNPSGWMSDPGLLRVVAAEYVKYLAASLRMRIESVGPTAMASAGTL